MVAVLESRERTYSYERMMRAVGSYLDDRDAEKITIMENARGFEIRMLGRDAEAESHRLTHRELLLIEADLVERRTQPARHRTGSHHSHYEDMLRALGHELEQHSIHGVLVDEEDDGFLVTYSQHDPATGYLRKRCLFLDHHTSEELLAGARLRRRLPRRRIFSRYQ